MNGRLRQEPSVPRELIPIILFNVCGLVAIAFSPIGRAIARRIGGDKVDEGEVAELRGELSELRAELDDTRSRLAQLDEMQERLDFAERVLAQARDKAALPEAR